MIVVEAQKCPKCGACFEPKRSNQTYCSRGCQRNAARGSRQTHLSPSQCYDNRRQWSLLHWLNGTYYGTPPGERLGLLKNWLDTAREGNTALREVLSKPAFVRPDSGEWGAFHRRCWAYPPVPQLADLFCRKLRRCRVWEWVDGSAPEPETGEINPPPAYEVAA